MAITKVAEGAFLVEEDGTTQNLTLPGTPLENDIVVVAFGNDNFVAGVTINTSDYVAIHSIGGGSGTPGRWIAYKRMGSTPDTVVNVDSEGADSAVVIQVWRGVDTTTALDATPTNTTGTSASADPPSITTVTNGALVFAVAIFDDDDAAATATAPSGYTNLIAGDTGNASTSVGATVMMASKTVATAGAEDPAAFGGTADDQWAAITFALRPAAGGSTITTSGAATVPSASASGSAAYERKTSGAATTAAVTASGAAERSVVASGAATAPAASAAGSAQVGAVVTSAGAAIVPAAAASGLAERQITASAAAVAPSAQAAGVAVRQITAAAVAVAPSAVADGSAAVATDGEIAASGAAIAPAAQAAGTATREITSSGAAVVPSVVADGRDAPTSRSGSGAARLANVRRVSDDRWIEAEVVEVVNEIAEAKAEVVEAAQEAETPAEVEELATNVRSIVSEIKASIAALPELDEQQDDEIERDFMEFVKFVLRRHG
jgi:hypothetical protein